MNQSQKIRTITMKIFSFKKSNLLTVEFTDNNFNYHIDFDLETSSGYIEKERVNKDLTKDWTVETFQKIGTFDEILKQVPVEIKDFIENLIMAYKQHDLELINSYEKKTS